jgi:DNA-binding beta-propeller fold protein YncE
MNRETAQIKRITDSQFFTRGIKRGMWKVFGGAVISCLLCSTAMLAANDDPPFLPGPVRVVSTVPANGDGNPYGVAFVPPSFPAGGTINPGDVLVSNFNNAPTSTGGNLQGTGTTIVDVPPNAPVTLFFQSKTPTGLTTALNVLQRGFVLVGNFPSTDGTLATATSGSILVIDKKGKLKSTYTDNSVQGPWDSALFDQGGRALYFVANALNGTIVRYNLDVDFSGVTFENPTVIASGYLHGPDAVTFVDAPTGLVYDPSKNVLYVASTEDNAVYAVSDAGDRQHDGGIGKLIYKDNTHLHGALGLAMASNGHLLVTNNDSALINLDPNQPSELVEFTVEGEFVKEISLDPLPGGSFGLAVETLGNTAKLAAVDDNVNLFLIWTLNAH